MTPSLPRVMIWVPTCERTSAVDPAGLLLDQRGFVVVAEQVGRAVDEVADDVALGPRQLLRRSAANGMPWSRQARVCRSMPSGSSGPIEHEVEVAAEREQVDVA